MISANFYIIFIVFYFILFCSAPLSSIVSGAIQIYFVIVILIATAKNNLHVSGHCLEGFLDLGRRSKVKIIATSNPLLWQRHAYISTVWRRSSFV